MSDNVAITPGSGATVAADDVGGGVLVQRVKAVLGADGTGVDPAAGVGASGTDTQRVVLADTIANPTSTLTRPSNTTAYAIGDLIASSTTAGSITVPSFTAAAFSAGGGIIRRLRLATNKTSGMGSVAMNVHLWASAPTFSNGDNGAYAVATGAANYLGAFTVTLAQMSDGAVGVAVPVVGSDVLFRLGSGQSIYWSLELLTAFTPSSGQTFTLTAEVIN
jgi:hypothetical protein